MIGDRADDIRAARAHGVLAVAARWGYGADAELRAAQPDHVATTIADVIAWYNPDHVPKHQDTSELRAPATDDEIRASALQFVRKLSGSSRPSKANELVFNQAVDEVTEAAERLIRSLTTSAPSRNREIEAQKAQERARQRYA